MSAVAHILVHFINILSAVLVPVDLHQSYWGTA